MKKLLHIFLLGAMMASCTGIETSEYDKDGNKLFPIDRLSFAVTVSEPETEAAMTAWVTGDKINLWFTTHYSQSTPDMTLLYDGSSWNRSFLKDGCAIPQDGTFAVLYESANVLGDLPVDVQPTRSTYTLPASSVEGGNYNCTPLLMTTSNQNYTIDPNTDVLSATISGWAYATCFKVLVKSSPSLVKKANNYALGVSKECHPINEFGPAKDFGADRVSFSISSNVEERYAGGVQEADGIAFYFDRMSCENEKITFSLLEKGGQTKAYTTPSAKTLDATSPSKFVGAALSYASFTPTEASVNTPERYGEVTDIDIEGNGPFDIIYHQNDLDDSTTFALANKLASRIQTSKGDSPRVIDSDNMNAQRREIIIGRTSRPQSQSYYSVRNDDFVWKINCTEGNVVITAGGSWALEYAVNKFTEDYLTPGYVYTEGKVEEGTVRGQHLFPLTDGCNLRILDYNVWERDSDTNAEAWGSTGESCALSVRMRRFSQLIRAYMPDVLTFQEYSNTFNNAMKDSLGKYNYDYTKRLSNDYTPVLYNKSTIEYVKRYHLVFGETFTGSDGIEKKPGIRKSYTAHVYRHKDTGKQFIVVSTHLWATVETEADYECKLDEATKLKNGIAGIIGSYDLPVFLAGDMNCKIDSAPMKLLTDNGYQNLVDIATVSADGSMGWHYCNEKAFKREYELKSWWMGTKHDRNDRGRNCVDQFFLYNNKSGVEVKVFERIHTWFTILISDHYPNYADIKL